MPEVERTEPPRRMRPTAFLVFAAILMVVLLAVLEAGGRVYVRTRRSPLFDSPYLNDVVRRYDPELMWSLKPNTDMGLIQTNALGLRNPPVEPKGNRVRVLAIGDSTTLGVGSDYAGSWPAQLQALLDSKAPGRFDVVYAGVPGYSAVQGLRYLELRGYKLQPDIVIATFGHNDCVNLEMTGGISDLEWRNPEKGSGLLALVKAAMEGAGMAKHKEENGRQSRLTHDEFLQALLDVDAWCAQAEAELIYLYWPYKGDLGQPAPRAPMHFVFEAGERSGRRVIDLAPAVRGSADEAYCDGVHMNAFGNKCVAQHIAEELL